MTDNESHRQKHCKILEMNTNFLSGMNFFMQEAYYRQSEHIEKIKCTQNNDHLEVTKFLIAKTLKSFDAVRILIANGLTDQALACVRIMMETDIVMQHLTGEFTKNKIADKENSELRIERFKDYKNIDEAKIADIVAAHNQEPNDASESRTALEQAIKCFKEKHEGGNTRNWHGANMNELFGNSHKPNEYATYKRLCGHVHPSFREANQYHDSEGNVTLFPNFTDSKLAAFLAGRILLDALGNFLLYHASNGSTEVFLEYSTNYLYRVQLEFKNLGDNVLKHYGNGFKMKWIEDTTLLSENK